MAHKIARLSFHVADISNAFVRRKRPVGSSDRSTTIPLHVFFSPNTNSSLKLMDHNHPLPVLSSPNLSLIHVFKTRPIYALSFLLLLLLTFFFCFSSLSGQFQAPSLAALGFLLPKARSWPGKVCDYSNGRWVWDEDYRLQSYNENCSFLDPGFRCQLNGRVDGGFPMWRWQPVGCHLPRFNARDMLERSRNGRIVFAGDSIGRNQWESLVCMLAQPIANQSSIHEVNGRSITKHKGFLSIKFDEYNLTVEYYRAPFLVKVDRPPANSSDEVRSAVRVDTLHWYSKKWVGADVLIFNAGHWWNKGKTEKMGCYFQEGETINMKMNVIEAFEKAIDSWKKWAIANLDSQKSHVFFRSFSSIHYRGGAWDNGGTCDQFSAPGTNYTGLQREPWNNAVISDAIERMKDEKRKIKLLNITYLTELRPDGHPSIHREFGTPDPIRQDCSHWCLPGVPDSWNELLYAYLLSMGYNSPRSIDKRASIT